MVHVGWAFLIQGFMRPALVEFFSELIEALLLLQKIRSSGPCRLHFQRTVHALVTAVLFRMTRLDSLELDAKPEPQDREFRETGKALRSKRDPVVSPHGERQTVLAKGHE